MRIQWQSTTSDADISANQSLASEGAETVTDKDAGQPCSPSVLDEYNDSQDLHQSYVSEGDKLQSDIPDETPVALRTRSKCQRIDEHTLDVNDILDRSQFGNEVQELILQLIKQSEEQKNKLSSAIESHWTIVKELQGEIALLRKQISSQKFKVSFPKNDRRRVKRFTPTGKTNGQKFNSNGFSSSAAMMPESPSSENELQEANIARIKEAEAALKAHILWRSEYEAKESEESVPDTSELDGSSEAESLSHDYREAITDTSDLDASAESDFPSPLKFSRNDKPHWQGHKWNSYINPKEPKQDRIEATARISKALDQVNLSEHLNPQGKRKTATLYVGNLEYNTSVQDLGESLDEVFRKIRVEKITIPKVQGRSKYGFIEISWAQRAPVDIQDICIKHSGMIYVNSRPIYFRKLRNKNDRE